MAKPTTNPEWASDADAPIAEPTASKKGAGWLAAEKPPHQYFNWWMNLVYQWIAYLEGATDSVANFLVQHLSSGAHYEMTADGGAGEPSIDVYATGNADDEPSQRWRTAGGTSVAAAVEAAGGMLSTGFDIYGPGDVQANDPSDTGQNLDEATYRPADGGYLTHTNNDSTDYRYIGRALRPIAGHKITQAWLAADIDDATQYIRLYLREKPWNSATVTDLDLDPDTANVYLEVTGSTGVVTASKTTLALSLDATKVYYPMIIINRQTAGAGNLIKFLAAMFKYAPDQTI